MDTLTSIREVAEYFGLPLSTLHYWERRGLLAPYRRSGGRCYDEDQLYRIALIKQWRETGRLSIEEIAELLDTNGGWRDTVAERVTAIDEDIARLHSARAYLVYLQGCRKTSELERCPGFRAEVALP